MSVKDYTKEFYKLTIRFGHRELSKEKIAQYVNGLRFNIQDEVGMMKIESIEEAYQYALKVEVKLKRKSQVNSKEKEKSDNSEKSKPSAIEDEPKLVEQKRRIGRGEFKGTCYECTMGHRSFECSQRATDRRIVVVSEIKSSVVEIEQGENLMAW